jgi:hypothetical protein
MALGEIAGQYSGALKGVGAAAMVVVYALIFGAVIFVFYYLTSHNVTVYIKEKIGSSYITRKSKGKFYKDKKSNDIELFTILKNKEWNKPLDRGFLEPVKGGLFGGISYHAHFVKDADGNLQPVKPNYELVKWEGFRSAHVEFGIRNIVKAIDEFSDKGWLEKYGPMIVLGLFVLIVILQIVFIREIANLVPPLQAVADSIKGASQTVGTQVIGN